MLRQFKIDVQVSPYPKADKRLLIEHTDDYLLMYEPLDSKDTDVSGDIKKTSSLVDHHILSLVHDLEDLEIHYQQGRQARDNPKGYLIIFLRWMNSHRLVYLPYGSQSSDDCLHEPGRYFSDAVQSSLVQAIQYHLNQIKNCQYVEHILLIDLANGLLRRQIGSL